MLISLVVCLHLCPSEKLIDLEVYTLVHCIHLSTIHLEYSEWLLFITTCSTSQIKQMALFLLNSCPSSMKRSFEINTCTCISFKKLRLINLLKCIHVVVNCV